MHRGIKVINSAGAIKSVGATGATGATGSTGANGSNGTNGADLAHPWSGKIAAAYGDGNPHLVMAGLNNVWSTANATPTAITTSVARISYFTLPFDLTVNKIRYFAPGTVASAYSVAIYRVSDLARLTSQIDFDTTANTWGAAGSALNLSLVKNTAYFIAVSVRTTGATAGIGCFTPASNTSSPQTKILPTAQPGNLDIDSVFAGQASLGQFAVTTGVLPDPAATLAVQGSWTGGMPGFFLDNSNA